MAFSSGTFSLYTPGNPVVTGTTISSDWANNTLTDIATGLSTCVLKDGSQTITANIPMGGFKFTGLAAGTTAGNSVRFEQLLGLGSIGTARQVPMVNAGATALAFTNPLTLGTMQATTSGTAFNFTSLPAGLRRITIHFVGVSLSGTDNLLVQIGDTNGVSATGYVSTGGALNNAGASVGVDSTAGFLVVGGNAANVISGKMVLDLVDAATFQWVSNHAMKPNTTAALVGGGDKALAAVLDRLTITRTGTDTFDAGAVNISYE